MRTDIGRIIFACSCLAFLTAAHPGLSSAAEGNDGAGVSPGSAPGLEAVPVKPAEPSAPQSGRDYLSIFRNNAADNPDVSADALIRILNRLLPEEREPFLLTHCGKIAEMIAALDRAAAERRITEERYSDLTSSLEPFEIRTIKVWNSDAGTALRAGGKKSSVDVLVEVSIAARSGDKKKAEEAMLAARSAYPGNASVQTAAATYYNEASNFAMAEKTATEAIALDSKNPDAYKARALARASLEDRKGAIEDIKKAMAIDPQDESARVLSALLESRKAGITLKSISSLDGMNRALGAPGEAAAAVGGASAVVGGPAGGAEAMLAAPDISRSKAYFKTAVAKNRLGDYENAVRYASLAIEKDPANSGAYLERANAYNFLGRYDDAVRDTGAVIEKDPANLQAFNMRAWALNRKGRARDAETDASRAIGLNPGFADAWFNRALAYEKQGDYKRMLADFKQAAALSEAYAGRYQDAVAQYGPRVLGYAAAPARRPGASETAGRAHGPHHRTPLKRFLITLLFTLSGGALMALGLVHIVTARRAEEGSGARITHPDVLSPSVFYEGVATGKYKIERKLGEGAMGVVYQATDQSLGRQVAIKKMGEEVKVNDREKQRFLDEARTVALLHHPNIVEIHTIFEEENDIYLVFEYVDGLTLDKVLAKEARLPFERVLALFGETAGALAYAHSKNIVHRDLKLSNIMVSSEGGIKVMDFGLARHAKESIARSSNKEVVGSPAYMAPEQDLGVSSVESDIYSLGVCLYEVLSGVLPFQGPDFHSQKARKAYQPLSDILPGLPKGMDAVVGKCLAPVPEERFHSAEEFRRALNATV